MEPKFPDPNFPVFNPNSYPNFSNFNDGVSKLKEILKDNFEKSKNEPKKEQHLNVVVNHLVECLENDDINKYPSCKMCRNVCRRNYTNFPISENENNFVNGVFGLENNEERIPICHHCRNCFVEVLKCDRDKTLPRDLIKKINVVRGKNGKNTLFLKQKPPPMPSEEEVFYKNQEKKVDIDSILLEKSREESDWYVLHKLDFISCKIELPILVGILNERNCSTVGCSCKMMVKRDKISSIGVVLRIPWECAVGHCGIFHTSSFDSKFEYLLNKFEGFSISSSSPGLPQIRLKNVLSGDPSLSYTRIKEKSTTFFKVVEENKKKDFNEVRKNYLFKYIRLLVDMRLARMFFHDIYPFSSERVKLSMNKEEKIKVLLMDKKFVQYYKNILQKVKKLGIFGPDSIDISAHIFSFMYGNNCYFTGEGDGRFTSPGFQALQGTAIIMDSICSTPLFVHNTQKARNTTEKSKINKDVNTCKEHQFYEGPSANIEKVAIGGCFDKMIDWYYPFNLCDELIKISIRLMLGTCVTDRDGKIIHLYMNKFGELIKSGEIRCCRFEACYGHGKKTFHNLLSKITTKKYIEMCKKDLDFAFKNYKNTPQYKTLDKNATDFEDKAINILLDVFVNCLDHHLGKCKCKKFGLPCKGRTSVAINVGIPSGKFLADHLREAYIEIGQLFPVLIRKRTTSKVENINASIAAFVPKRLDFRTTYSGRVIFKILALLFKGNVYIQYLLNEDLPVCPHTLYMLEKHDTELKKMAEKRKLQKNISQRYENRSNLKWMHASKSKDETYYSKNKEEKENRDIDFSDIHGLTKKTGLLKRDIPKFNKIKNTTTYDNIKTIIKAQKEGKTFEYLFICKYCEKRDIKTFRKNEADMIKHMKKSHKRAKPENLRENMKQELIVMEKKK